MVTDEQREKVKGLLLRLGIPHHSLTVFGTVNINIHAVCESRATADKWQFALINFCRDVRLVETVIYAKKNIGGNLNPTRRRGYLIGGIVGKK